ncbi:unconventional myosin-XV-like [Thraustotheca clavata]|uniref:Unconventional myosin-XV-like n=1 Tax=Thraustotheca clavata TaxID=74557 RepID=A0A1V9ZZ99_9STRA|nr:unconventional myosin-XV-like [Thraustotheca clavata]
MAENRWFYADDFDKVHGPCCMNEMRELWRQGSLQIDTIVWHPNQTEWLSIGELPWFLLRLTTKDAIHACLLRRSASLKPVGSQKVMVQRKGQSVVLEKPLDVDQKNSQDSKTMQISTAGVANGSCARVKMMCPKAIAKLLCTNECPPNIHHHATIEGFHYDIDPSTCVLDVDTFTPKINESQQEEIDPENLLITRASDLSQYSDDLLQLRSGSSVPLALHVLQDRCMKNQGCSWLGSSGTCLVSIKTPHLPELQNDSCMAPSIELMAMNAYKAALEQHKSQVIILCGESGSGKSDAAKQIISQLSSLVKNESTSKIYTATQCILDAFGNAKTAKSSSSTRYCRLTSLNFHNNEIVDISTKFYLVERVRIVRQLRDENSYHIFYQLLHSEHASKYNLTTKDAFTFAQPLIGDIPGSIQNTIDSLAIIGIQDYDSVFKVVAAILHLGNITFNSLDESQAQIAEHQPLQFAAKCLGVLDKSLEEALCFNVLEIGSRHEKEMVPNDIARAYKAVEALSKLLYCQVFEKLVEQANSNGTSEALCISILDMFGFENLPINHLSQLCINYANETFKNYFFNLTSTGIKMLLEDECINTSAPLVDKIVLELLDKKPLGLFHLLDEQSRVVCGGDKQFINGIYKIKSRVLILPRNTTLKTFTIQHYASQVTYTAEGFTEANKELAHPIFTDMLSKSTLDFVQSLCTKPAGRGKSLVTDFRSQLASLIHEIAPLTPRFIHCVSPYSNAESKGFSLSKVEEQLRSMGLFRLMEMREEIFPISISHIDWVQRYHFGFAHSATPFETCKQIIAALQLSSNQIQVHSNMVFMQQPVHQALEFCRKVYLKNFTQTLERVARGYLVREKSRRLQAIDETMSWVDTTLEESSNQDDSAVGNTKAQETPEESPNCIDELRNSLQIQSHKERLESMANAAIAQLDRLALEGIRKEALEANIELSVGDEISRLVGLPQESFLKLQLSQAVQAKDMHAVVMRSIELKQLFLQVHGWMFSLEDLSLLRSPMEFANSRFYGLSWSNPKEFSDGMLKFSPKPIPISLTQLTPATSREAVRFFKGVLGYMGLRRQTTITIDEMIYKGLTMSELRAEIFVQILKQLRGTPTESLGDKAWSLLILSLAHFPPPPLLENFLAMFIQDRAKGPWANKLQKMLHERLVFGPLLQVLSSNSMAKLLDGFYQGNSHRSSLAKSFVEATHNHASIILMDFTGDTIIGTLTVVAGDQVQVLNARSQWLYVRNGNGMCGYVPGSYVRFT